MKLFFQAFSQTFLVLLFLAAPGWAVSPDLVVSEPWIGAPFTAPPADVLAAAMEITEEASEDLPILWHDERWSIRADGSLERTIRRVTFVRSAATPWASLRQSSASLQQSSREVSLRIISPDGAERIIDSRESFPGLAIGSVIEEEISEVEPAQSSAGSLWIYPLAEDSTVHRGRLTIETPLTIPLRYLPRGLDEYGVTAFETAKERLDESFRLRFDYGQVPRPLVEPDLPGIIPDGPQIAVSTGKDWASIARAASALFDNALMMSDPATLLERLAPAEISAEMAPQVAPQVAPQPVAQTEKLAALLTAVHAAVQGEPTAWDGRVPASPLAVLDAGAGTPADKAALLIAALRGLDLPAYPAFVRPAPAQDVPRGLPGAGLFRHVLVYVPGSRPLWIDPSEPAARLGQLAPRLQGRWALIGSGTSEGLVRTPTSQSIDNRVEVVREVDLAERGPGQIVESTVLHGAFELTRRRAALHTQESARREAHLAYARNTLRAEAIGALSESDGSDFSTPFTTRLEALRSGVAVTDLNQAVVAVATPGLWSYLPQHLVRQGPQKGPARRLDLTQPIPFVSEWTYRIRPPVGFTLREVPEGIFQEGVATQEVGPARLTRRIETAADGEVTLRLRFDSGVRILSPDDVEALRSALAALSAEGPLLLFFDHQAFDSQGVVENPRSLFKAHHELIVAEPKAVIHRIRLVQALLDAGLGESAQAEARRAIEVDPTSTLAYQTLGRALSSGTLGRLYHPGWNRPLAIAAYERALQLDPTSAEARRGLAQVLEHDARGRRFSPAADVDRALALYRESPSTTLDYLSTLAALDRWSDLALAAEELLPRSGGDLAATSLKLAAKAVLESTDSALETARRIAPEDSSRWALVGTTARYLLLARRYDEASAFFTAAAGGAPDPESVLSQAEAVGRAMRHETLPLDPEDPASLVRQLVALVGRKEALASTSPTEIAEVFHSSYLSHRGTTRQDLRPIFAALRRTWFAGSSMDLSPEVAVDLAIASLRAEVDGSIERGHRFILTTLSGRTIEVFVAFDDAAGGYRVVALDIDPGQLGAEALRRLVRRDLKGLRQWLAWAQDLAPADHPFALFWPGVATSDDTETLELAAALWMAGHPEVSEAESILRDVLAATHDAQERELAEKALALPIATPQRDVSVQEALEKATRQAEKGEAAALETLRRALDAADLPGPEGLLRQIPTRLVTVWGIPPS